MERKQLTLFFRVTAIVSLLFLCLSSGGCLKERSEMEKEILAHDPFFKKTLDKRNSLRGQLDSRKSALVKNEQEIAAQITALREKKAQAKRVYAVSVERIKRQIDPEKRELERNLMELKRNYDLKKVELRNVNRDIEEIEALIRKKDKLTLTQEEVRTWNERLASLIRKKEIIISEKDKLRKETEITKLKLKVLKP
ncbi:MAG: hypothetical protein U9R44_06610 [Candidatus Omnitrophota bacterium]|nr:hypothetical protein [Candidatus Omnitrophota bacterium]